MRFGFVCRQRDVFLVGGERALFVILDGKIEAVKLVDGIPRVVPSSAR